jgi:mono/diheme cytochrome c family protein
MRARAPIACALLAALFLSFAALAQRGADRAPPGFPDAPGKDVLVAKCFQCHGPNMWMAQRQDRRAWEATLYRMVGRGALWTEEEIKAMADYLGVVYGRKPQ